MPCLAYTEMDQTKYRVSSMFAFGCIIWTLLHMFACTYSGWLISDNKIIRNENGIPLRRDTPRYWLQFNWSAAYALCVLKLRYNQNRPFLVQSHISIFKNHAYFSVTSIALNDVSVRGGNVTKPFGREIDTSQKFVSLWQIKGK